MSAAPDPPSCDESDDVQEFSLFDLLLPLAENLRWLVLGPLVAGLAALGASFLLTPVFTSRTVILPPQQQQSAAASALASLGGLGALAAGGGALRNPVDQYISLMQSDTVLDRLIDQFALMQVYEERLRREARRTLLANTRITAGKKDGLIVVEVDDEDPKRAAAMASQYVEELRRMTTVLAVTEAQQRRRFFEEQMQRTGAELARAQLALQTSGFTPGALRAEPRAAAEQYARVRAEVTAAEVRLQALRARLTDVSPEVQQTQSTLAALRAQLARLEQAPGSEEAGSDYIGRFREFKYQETLFELFARQYELARLDESREGALVQVVDPAAVPEWKSAPRRARIAATTAALALALVVAVLIGAARWRAAYQDPTFALRAQRLRQALRRR